MENSRNSGRWNLADIRTQKILEPNGIKPKRSAFELCKDCKDWTFLLLLFLLLLLLNSLGKVWGVLTPRMHCPMRKRRPTCDSDFSAIAVPSMHGSGYLDYTVETHASRCLRAMEEFRRLGMLCDLVLRVSHRDKTTDFKVRRIHTIDMIKCTLVFLFIKLKLKVILKEIGESTPAMWDTKIFTISDWFHLWKDFECIIIIEKHLGFLKNL